MWDIAIDNNGDWFFSPNHDYQEATGIAIYRQRIMARLKIPRGSFHYNPSGRLGSRLYLSSRHSNERAVFELPSLVKEALAPMTDIAITKLEVEMDKNQRDRVVVSIGYTPILPGVNARAVQPDVFSFVV